VLDQFLSGNFEIVYCIAIPPKRASAFQVPILKAFDFQASTKSLLESIHISARGSGPFMEYSLADSKLLLYHQQEIENLVFCVVSLSNAGSCF